MTEEIKLHELYIKLIDKLDSIKTSIDILNERSAGYEKRILSLESTAREVNQKIHDGDILITKLTSMVESNTNKWAKSIDVIFKIVVSAITGFLLYKLGLS